MKSFDCADDELTATDPSKHVVLPTANSNERLKQHQPNPFYCEKECTPLDFSQNVESTVAPQRTRSNSPITNSPNIAMKSRKNPRAVTGNPILQKLAGSIEDVKSIEKIAMPNPLKMFENTSDKCSTYDKTRSIETASTRTKLSFNSNLKKESREIERMESRSLSHGLSKNDNTIQNELSLVNKPDFITPPEPLQLEQGNKQVTCFICKSKESLKCCIVI